MMMRKAKLLLCMMAAGFAAPLQASNSNYGTIGVIYGTSSGAVLFTTNGSRSAVPGCQGAGLGQRWALDASTIAGQAQVAILLEAYEQGKRIYVGGKGVCTIWSDTETVEFFNTDS